MSINLLALILLLAIWTYLVHEVLVNPPDWFSEIPEYLKGEKGDVGFY